MHKLISIIAAVHRCRAPIAKAERLPVELKGKSHSTAHLGTQYQRGALMETTAALQCAISQDGRAQDRKRLTARVQCTAAEREGRSAEGQQ